MADFLKRFGRGAVAGGGGAAQGFLQHLLMQQEQERFEGEQAETQKTSNLQRLLLQARIDEMGQEEPEKPPTETGEFGRLLREDPDEYIRIKRAISGKGETTAGKIFGAAKGGYYQRQPSGEVEKIVPGRPTTEKPALDPKDVMGMLFNLETAAREEGGAFEGMDVDSAFTELATKAGIPLPGRAKPQRSRIIDEIMRGGEQAPTGEQPAPQNFHGALTLQQAFDGIANAEKQGVYSTEEAESLRQKAREFFGAR